MRRAHLRHILGWAGLVCWFAAMLVVGVTLLARHAVALPLPPTNDALARAMASLRRPGEEGRWLAVHVLYTQCKCSQRIVDHLVASERPGDVAERVLLVGRDPGVEARLASRGLTVVPVDETELGTRYHITAVPLFIVVSPAGAVRYAGGYTTRKQGPDPRDLQILAAAREGGSLASLPLFGCAVSDRLRAALNPIGLP